MTDTVKHLNNDELASCVAFGPLNGMAEHLAQCAVCRAELESTRTMLSGFGAAARQEAERDEWFWARQRAAISQRVRDGRVPRVGFQWALAGVAAMALLASSLLIRTPVPQTAASSDAADEALLLEIQSDVSRSVPAALSAVQPIAEQLTAQVTNRDSRGERND